MTRTERDGSISVVMDNYNGRKLNAPNDVAVAADGAIWFTGPGRGRFGNYERHRSRGVAAGVAPMAGRSDRPR